MARYVTREGDTADLIAWRVYGTHDNGALERLLDANPGLADRGPVLPAGVLVELPEFQPAATAGGVRLWE